MVKDRVLLPSCQADSYHTQTRNSQNSQNILGRRLSYTEGGTVGLDFSVQMHSRLIMDVLGEVAHLVKKADNGRRRAE
jgi:hypothetical protein